MSTPTSAAPAGQVAGAECGRCGGAGIDPATSTTDAPCSNCRMPHDGAASRLDWQRIYDRGFEDGRTSRCQPVPSPTDSDLRSAVRELRRRYGGHKVAEELLRQAEQRY